MDKKKKDLELVGLLCLTAVAGFANILLSGNTKNLFFYCFFMCLSISGLYFAYSLCKLSNRWENFWKEKNPGSGESSKWLLLTTKITLWAFYVLGCLVALVA
ncbi:MAG: hypothetical protein E7343_02485 [Clostridiales bacterium]|nr:hypothetical protein [Clostridiales bacterium]